MGNSILSGNYYHNISIHIDGIFLIFQNFLRKESELKYNKSEGDSKRFREAGNKYYMGGTDIAFNLWMITNNFRQGRTLKPLSSLTRQS